MITQKATRITLLALGLTLATAAIAAPNYEKRFQRWDKNGDGTICVEEMEANMVEMAEKQAERKNWSAEETEKRVEGAKSRAPERLADADTDGDGKLSQDEFTAMVTKK
jgi:Ca2+-binding EF-hand superfamily protein